MGTDDARERGQRAGVLQARDQGGNDGMADDVGGGVLVGCEAQALADAILDGIAATARA